MKNIHTSTLLYQHLNQSNMLTNLDKCKNIQYLRQCRTEVDRTWDGLGAINVLKRDIANQFGSLTTEILEMELKKWIVSNSRSWTINT